MSFKVKVTHELFNMQVMSQVLFCPNKSKQLINNKGYVQIK